MCLCFPERDNDKVCPSNYTAIVKRFSALENTTGNDIEARYEIILYIGYSYRSSPSPETRVDLFVEI